MQSLPVKGSSSAAQARSPAARTPAPLQQTVWIRSTKVNRDAWSGVARGRRTGSVRHMSPARARLAAVAGGLLAILALSACSSGSSGPKGSADVRLDNVPDGVGTLHFDTRTKIVSLDLDGWGFAPSSKHAIHVHPGKCLDTHNAPTITLPDLAADDKGRVKTTVRTGQPVANGIPTAGRLDIHGEGETPIICTDLGADPTAAKRLYPQPSEKPFAPWRP